MNERGCDRTYPLTDGEATAFRTRYGGRWVGGYLPAPFGHWGSWTPDAVRHVFAQGLLFLPIYVGQQLGGRYTTGVLTPEQGHADGLDALNQLQRFGFNPAAGGPLCLDVEGETYYSHPAQAVSYADAWCATVRAAGPLTVLYGPGALARAVAGYTGHPDAAWVAAWVGLGFRPDLASSGAPDIGGGLYPADRMGWQYSGGTVAPGLSGAVDWSVSSFPLWADIDDVYDPVSGGTTHHPVRSDPFTTWGYRMDVIEAEFNGSTEHCGWVDATGHAWLDSFADGTEKPTTDHVGDGHMPNSPVVLNVDPWGKLNFRAVGANGDRFHWQLQGTRWVGLHE